MPLQLGRFYLISELLLTVTSRSRSGIVTRQLAAVALLATWLPARPTQSMCVFETQF